MISKLTNDELDLIEKYRDLYAHSGYDVMSSPAPIEKILEPWSQKKQKLYKLLGENLIIKRPISWKTDVFELRNKIRDFSEGLRSSLVFQRLLTAIKSFNHIYWEQGDWIAADFIHKLTNCYELEHNEFQIYGDHGKFTYDCPNDKKITIPEKGKPMKMLQKLVKAFIFDEELLKEFEDLRIQHSMLFNQKKLEGELCISIHPLDYMTMSDNDCNWHTCMSWTNWDGGEYKQGTVEMMNSPNVVVAYLESDDHQFDFAYNSYEPYFWNNKKWRQLFIVEDDFILSVKPYPYENCFLTKEVIKVLRDELGWDSKVHKFEPYKFQTIEGRKIKLRPETGAMYNDFDRCDHFICVNPEAPKELDKIVEYSGPSECMFCGETNDDWHHERLLGCQKCLDVLICQCGEIISEDNAHWVGDRCFCEECFCECTEEDDITGETVLSDDCHIIKLSQSNDCYEDCGNIRSITTAVPLNKLKELYFTDVHIEEGFWDNFHYVYPKDLTKAGYKLFGFDDEEHSLFSEYMSDDKNTGQSFVAIPLGNYTMHSLDDELPF